MALATLGELNSALTQYTGRSTLVSLYPGWIGLAETQMNNGDGELNFRPLRVRQMETGPVTVTVTSNLGPLPSGFLQAKRVTRSSDGGVVTYLPEETYAERYPSGDTDSHPLNYTVIGDNIVVSADVKLVYYTAIPTLVGGDDEDTNWLLTKAPNAYLYGCLYHYAIYAKQFDKAGGYFDMMRRALAALNVSNLFSQAGSLNVPAGTVATP